MIVTVLLVILPAVAAWATAFVLLQNESAKHEDHMNRLNPDGPEDHDPTHGGIQTYLGPGCGWCCEVLYWFGIPYGTRCVYVCNSGH